MVFSFIFHSLLCALVYDPISKLVLCVISHGAIASHSPLCVRIQFITLHFICHMWFFVFSSSLTLFLALLSVGTCETRRLLTLFRFVKSHFYLETNLQTHLNATQNAIVQYFKSHLYFFLLLLFLTRYLNWWKISFSWITLPHAHRHHYTQTHLPNNTSMLRHKISFCRIIAFKTSNQRMTKIIHESESAAQLCNLSSAIA